MATYRVKFEIECLVDSEIEVGEDGDVLYDEHMPVNVDTEIPVHAWNEIVGNALDMMEDIGYNDCVKVTREDE